MQYHLNLAHLYGDLLNTYSDIGNILVLKYYAKKHEYFLVASSWKHILDVSMRE